MVRFNNSGKALLSTNVSNTKSRIYLFVYLCACLSIFVRFPVLLSGLSPVRHSSIKVRARKGEKKQLPGTENSEASSPLEKGGVFGKLQ